MKHWLLAGLLIGCGVGFAGGQATTIPRPSGSEPIEVITPVFHQLLAFSSPANMVLHVSEHANDHFYLREAVRDVDTLNQWGQMITVTGDKGAAQLQAQPAKILADKLANGFQSACPKAFSFKDIGSLSMGTTPAYLMLVGCGSVEDKNGRMGITHSETALIVVLQGDQDMYTIQWAERGTAQAGAPSFNDVKWQRRFQQLQPLRLCSIVPGEKAPFQSCLGGVAPVKP